VPYLILSDIHANREALDAVLEDSRTACPDGYKATLCLGDVVGYGADPTYAIRWAQSAPQAIIRGNHDKVCAGIDSTEFYNASAQASAEWTAGVLSEGEAEYLRNQPRGPLRFEGMDLVHGSPRDEDEYLLEASQADEVREFLDAQVTFFGHTHVQGGFLLTPSGAAVIQTNRELQLEEDCDYLINPGSVGQPRDHDPRAAYAIYHDEARYVEFRRVKYDISKAAKKILRAGLPTSLAARLFDGR
jgi:diadenosine tetraphosphatase ApaH/serine/threonine PP2A family protein phosphatase